MEDDPLHERMKAEGKNRTPTAPAYPKGKSAILPDEDEHWDDDGEELADSIGMALFIDYTDGNGNTSARRVSISRIVKNKDGHIILVCYCYERSAPRCFRADRITQATDAATGEFIDTGKDIVEYFTRMQEGLLKDKVCATNLALKECRHALNILLFLGRCDGRLLPSEIDIVYQYLMQECFEYEISEDIVNRHIRRLYPDKSTYLSSLDAIKKKGDRQYKKLLRYACQMIEADEVILPEEFTFIQEIQPHLSD